LSMRLTRCSHLHLVYRQPRYTGVTTSWRGSRGVGPLPTPWRLQRCGLSLAWSIFGGSYSSTRAKCPHSLAAAPHGSFRACGRLRRGIWGALAGLGQEPRRLSNSREQSCYLPARRCQRVAFSIFLCFFLRIRLRRFLINEPMSRGHGSGSPEARVNGLLW